MKKINLTEKTHKRLTEQGNKGETYNDLINRLIDMVDGLEQ